MRAVPTASFFGSSRRVIVNRTSSAVTGRPSWNFTPCRMLIVHSSPALLDVCDSAIRGMALNVLPSSS
jgi:hypothetical protein